MVLTTALESCASSPGPPETGATVPSRDTVTLGGPWVAEELPPSRDVATGDKCVGLELPGDPVQPLGTLYTPWGHCTLLGDTVHPLVTLHTPWGPCTLPGDTVHPLGTLHVPRGYCALLGDPAHALGTLHTPWGHCTVPKLCLLSATPEPRRQLRLSPDNPARCCRSHSPSSFDPGVPQMSGVTLGNDASWQTTP